MSFYHVLIVLHRWCFMHGRPEIWICRIQFLSWFKHIDNVATVIPILENYILYFIVMWKVRIYTCTHMNNCLSVLTRVVHMSSCASVSRSVCVSSSYSTKVFCIEVLCMSSVYMLISLLKIEYICCCLICNSWLYAFYVSVIICYICYSLFVIKKST